MYGSCLSSLGVTNSRDIDRMFLGDSMNIMMIVDGFMLCCLRNIMDELGLNSFDFFSPIRPMSICMGYWCAHLVGMEMLKSR